MEVKENIAQKIRLPGQILRREISLPDSQWREKGKSHMPVKRKRRKDFYLDVLPRNCNLRPMGVEDLSIGV